MLCGANICTQKFPDYICCCMSLVQKMYGCGDSRCCCNETNFGKGKLGMKTYLGKNFPRSGPSPLLKWWAGPQGEGARPQGELIGKEEIGSNDATGSLVP